MAHDVFISHASTDKVHADALCAALEAEGIRCWVAPRDLLEGQTWPGGIAHAIENARVMVLIFSEHSNVSPAVLNEVVLATSDRVHILNFRVDSSPLNHDLRFLLSAQHWLDAMTPPMAANHARLVKAVRVLLSKDRPPKPVKPKKPDTDEGGEEEHGPKPVMPSFWKRRRRLIWACAPVCLCAFGIGGFLAWKNHHEVPAHSLDSTSSNSMIADAGTSPAPKPTPMSPALPRTREVKPGGSIEDALENANPGDTIHVAAGEYNDEKLIINKPNIHLIGDGKDTTFVRIDGAQGAVLTVTNCPSGEISGLCFEHTGVRKAGLYPLVWLKGSKVTMHNCDVRHSRNDGIRMLDGDQSIIDHCEVTYSSYAIGIAVYGTQTNPTLTSNHLSNNNVSGILFGEGAGGLAEKNNCTQNLIGICARGKSTAPTLRDNEIIDNGWQGIDVYSQASGRVEGNTCKQNGGSGIAVVDKDTSPTLSGNHCMGNTDYGIYVNEAEPVGADEHSNEVVGNTKGQVLHENPVPATGNASAPTSTPSDAPVAVTSSSPASNTDTAPTSTTSSPAFSPQTREIKPGESIQDVLENAHAGDTVHVAAGEYNEQLKMNKPGIHLIGEGKDKTFVRFDGAQGAVLTVSGCGSGEIVGFCFEHTGVRKVGDNPVVLLQSSKVTLHDCLMRHSRRDGILLRGGDQSTVEHCEVTYCDYSYGIAADGAQTAPTIKNNYISNSKLFGIFFGGGAGGLAEKNRCTQNGYGIGVQDALTAPILRKNEIVANETQGITLFGQAKGRVEDNICKQNGASGIAVFDKGTAPTLSGNHCTDNTDYGIYVNQATPIGATAHDNDVSGNAKGQVFREPTVVASKRKR